MVAFFNSSVNYKRKANVASIFLLKKLSHLSPPSIFFLHHQWQRLPTDLFSFFFFFHSFKVLTTLCNKKILPNSYAYITPKSHNYYSQLKHHHTGQNQKVPSRRLNVVPSSAAPHSQYPINLLLIFFTNMP